MRLIVAALSGSLNADRFSLADCSTRILELPTWEFPLKGLCQADDRDFQIETAVSATGRLQFCKANRQTAVRLSGLIKSPNL